MKHIRSVDVLVPVFNAIMLAAPLLMLSALAVRAQETPPAAAPSPCSGVMCIFGQQLGAAPQAAPTQPTPLPAPADALAQSAEVMPTDDAILVKAKPRPVRPSVTIAAEGAEAVRIKSLAAALPKEKVIVVGATGVPADFTVTAKLDALPSSPLGKPSPRSEYR